jgi:hypothetical protein
MTNVVRIAVVGGGRGAFFGSVLQGLSEIIALAAVCD